MRDYTKIEAWRLADDLTVAVYERTRCFPREENYGLTSQLRRAAYSVPANIVEGASRESKKDYLHFLYIARGSLSETQYFIHLARRLNYLSLEEADTLRQQTKIAFGCLHGLIQAVEKEAGKLSKVVAGVTSLIVIGLMRGLVVSCPLSRSPLSGSPFPSPNPDNAHRRRLPEERLHRYAPDLCW
jgi:four helix bundle protein